MFSSKLYLVSLRLVHYWAIQFIDTSSKTTSLITSICLTVCGEVDGTLTSSLATMPESLFSDEKCSSTKALMLLLNIV